MHAQLIAILVAHGASPTARDDNGASALHLAAEQGDSSTYQQLLCAGANVDARDKRGRTPAQCAKQAEHFELGNKLERKLQDTATIGIAASVDSDYASMTSDGRSTSAVTSAAATIARGNAEVTLHSNVIGCRVIASYALYLRAGTIGRHRRRAGCRHGRRWLRDGHDLDQCRHDD